MRAFIAYPLPKLLGQQLAGFQYRLQQQNIPLKPYPVANLHLTTAFLGDIPPETKNKLLQIVHSVNQETKPLNLATTNLSGFPRKERAGTLVLKISGPDVKKLKKAVGLLHTQLKQANFWLDQKPFLPHITLGRVKYPLNLTQNHLNAPKLKFQLKDMQLYQSHLTSEGPIYQLLSTQ
jgi:2'-5' RNA ligase